MPERRRAIREERPQRRVANPVGHSYALAADLIGESAAEQHPDLLLGTDSRQVTKGSVDDLEREAGSAGDPLAMDLLRELELMGRCDVEAREEGIDVRELVGSLRLRCG